MHATAGRTRWVSSIPFLLMHVAMFTAFLVPFSWNLVGLCAALYFVRMFAITAGYHRYFSHRTYKMGRAAQFVMAWVGSMSMQKGVLWWAANHRHHHRYSDEPADIHSPIQRGFWWSHMGWILSDQHEETRWDLVQDLAKYPELVWINQYWIVPVGTFAAGLLMLGGFPAFIWGFLISTVLLWHGTFTINSLSHVFGWRRYATSDTSRNNPLLAFITLGEGWHNNHHCYMSSTNQGFFWWELDPTFYLIKALSYVGLTRELRKPPLELLEARRVSRLPADRTTRPAVAIPDGNFLTANTTLTS